MIDKATHHHEHAPIAFAALQRAAKQAVALARQTGTPAWIMEGETMLDVTKAASPSEQPDLRQSALDALSAIYQRCQTANWDGEGAEAIQPQTWQTAHRLLEALSSDCPAPTVEPEPDGHLNLEWYLAPRRLLSVSVGPSDTLYWAALIGDEDPRGSCRFVDQFPQTLLYWIGKIYE